MKRNTTVLEHIIYIYIYIACQKIKQIYIFILTFFFYFRCLSYDTATNRTHYITSESPPLSFSADSKGEHKKKYNVSLSFLSN